MMCMIFGAIASVFSLFLCIKRRILNRVMRNELHAAVQMPTFDDVHKFKSEFRTHHHRLHDVYFVADALTLRLEHAADVFI